MKALCTEAALRALRRTYPQVYQENARLKIDKSKIFVTEVDIDDALASVQCSSRRSRPSFGLTLPPAAEPILRHTLAAAAKHISTFFPAATPAYKRLSAQCAGESDLSGEISSGASSIEADSSTVASFHGMDVVYRPKVLLYGVCGNAHGLIARALIQALDPVPCYSLDMHSLHMQTGSGGKALLEEAVVSTIAEARSRSPSIIFLPDFHTWWSSASDSLKMCLETSIKSLPPALQVLLLATADLSYETADLSEVLRSRHILSTHHGVPVAGPTEADRGNLFAGLPKDVRTWTEHPAVAAAPPALERDTVEAPWTKEYTDPQQKQREEKALRGMRMNLRKLCLKLLANKRYKNFHLPVLDSINEELRDSYRKCIANPMDLATALVQIDNRVSLHLLAFHAVPAWSMSCATLCLPFSCRMSHLL